MIKQPYSEFVTFVKGDGLARQNRFYVEMSVPSIAGEYAALWSDQQQIRDMILLCKGVNVPGVNISTTEVRTTGEVIAAPYDRNFGPATFTFYVDRQMNVRKMFDDWVNTIQNPYDRTLGWYNDLISPETKVYVLPKSENGAVYMIQLHELMPKTIGNLTLDQSTNDIMTLDVTFDYRYYTTERIEYVPATTTSGSIETFVYATPEQRKLPVGVQETYRYTPPGRNQIPGGQNVTENGIWDSTKMVPVNPVRALYDNYSAVAQTYASDFQKFQSTFASGEVIYNGVSVPLNINKALATLREQTLGTVKNKMVNSVFKKSGIRIKF